MGALGVAAAALNIAVAAFVIPDTASVSEAVALYVGGMFYGCLLAFQACTGGLAVLMVEIQVNGIQMGSSSLLESGQLIPALIGIFTVSSTLFDLVRKRLLQHRIDPDE